MDKYSIDEITLIEIDALIAMSRANTAGGSRMARIVRTVTEALSFGKYCNSTKAKSLNRRMSRAASDLMRGCSRREFEQRTILEHQMTIKQLCKQLCSEDNLDRERAFEILSSHPLVTITVEENNLLTKNKHRNQGTPEERYKHAKIEIIRVDEIVFAKNNARKAKRSDADKRRIPTR